MFIQLLCFELRTTDANILSARCVHAIFSPDYVEQSNGVMVPIKISSLV
jgi:hypothetical protein